MVLPYFVGSYAFIEGEPGTYASLISPEIHIEDHWCMEFFYHMNGADIGTLRVGTSTPMGYEVLLFSRQGHQGDHWHHTILKLSKGQFLINITATTGRGGRDDIALDDISIAECSFFSE